MKGALDCGIVVEEGLGMAPGPVIPIDDWDACIGRA